MDEEFMNESERRYRRLETLYDELEEQESYLASVINRTDIDAVLTEWNADSYDELVSIFKTEIENIKKEIDREESYYHPTYTLFDLEREQYGTPIPITI